MGEGRKIDVIYVEQATIRYRRARAFDQFRVIGWVLLNCCLLSISMGIVILVIGDGAESFPILSGSPIWSSLVVVFACVFAFVVGCYNPHYFRETDGEKLHTWILCYIISAVLSIIVCLISFGFTVYGTARCVKWKNQYGQLVLMCGSSYDVQIVMNVGAFLLSLFMIIFLIYGIVLYFVYKDVFQFYDWEIGYYNDYFYTMPGKRRVIETNPHYVTGEHYVTTDGVSYVERYPRYVTTDRASYIEHDSRYVTTDGASYVEHDPRYVTTESASYIERDPRYVKTDRYHTIEKPQVIDRIQYVKAERSPHTGSVQNSLKGNDDTRAADVVSEYGTSKHKYLVLRFDRNQIRPI